MEDRIEYITKKIEERIDKLNHEMEEAGKHGYYAKALECKCQIEALQWADQCVKLS